MDPRNLIILIFAFKVHMGVGFAIHTYFKVHLEK